MKKFNYFIITPLNPLFTQNSNVNSYSDDGNKALIEDLQSTVNYLEGLIYYVLKSTTKNTKKQQKELKPHLPYRI